MEQFKIDVSECTEDEKKRIQERLFEMGYHWCDTDKDFPLSRNDNPVWAMWDDGEITSGDMDYPERPASDFLKPRFQTRPHDYEGCHPDIATALKRGEEIKAKIKGRVSWVNGYSNDGAMQYTAKAEGSVSSYWVETKDIELIPAVLEKKAVTLELTDEQLTKIKEMIDVQ